MACGHAERRTTDFGQKYTISCQEREDPSSGFFRMFPPPAGAYCLIYHAPHGDSFLKFYWSKQHYVNLFVNFKTCVSFLQRIVKYLQNRSNLRTQLWTNHENATTWLPRLLQLLPAANWWKITKSVDISWGRATKPEKSATKLFCRGWKPLRRKGFQPRLFA